MSGAAGASHQQQGRGRDSVTATPNTDRDYHAVFASPHHTTVHHARHSDLGQPGGSLRSRTPGMDSVGSPSATTYAAAHATSASTRSDFMPAACARSLGGQVFEVWAVCPDVGVCAPGRPATGFDDAMWANACRTREGHPGTSCCGGWVVLAAARNQGGRSGKDKKCELLLACFPSQCFSCALEDGLLHPTCNLQQPNVPM